MNTNEPKPGNANNSDQAARPNIKILLFLEMRVTIKIFFLTNLIDFFK